MPWSRSVLPLAIPAGMVTSIRRPSGSWSGFLPPLAASVTSTSSVNETSPPRIRIPGRRPPPRPPPHPRPPPAAAPARAAEQVGEDALEVRLVAEDLARAVLGPARPVREAAVELVPRPLVAGGVDLALVEARALVGVRQQVVRHRQLLEPRLRRLVARVQVRVRRLGELAVGLADLVGRGRLGHAQHLVGVAHA